MDVVAETIVPLTLLPRSTQSRNGQCNKLWQKGNHHMVCRTASMFQAGTVHRANNFDDHERCE
jgi:hypothetical protein